MVKKKIKKFFNSVSICERMPVLFEERRKKNFPYPWVAAGAATVAVAVLAIWAVTRESE